MSHNRDLVTLKVHTSAEVAFLPRTTAPISGGSLAFSQTVPVASLAGSPAPLDHLPVEANQASLDDSTGTSSSGSDVPDEHQIPSSGQPLTASAHEAEVSSSAGDAEAENPGFAAFMRACAAAAGNVAKKYGDVGAPLLQQRILRPQPSAVKPVSRPVVEPSPAATHPTASMEATLGTSPLLVGRESTQFASANSSTQTLPPGRPSPAAANPTSVVPPQTASFLRSLADWQVSNFRPIPY